MPIAAKFGIPNLFITTMTCNPKWKEIKDNLLPGNRAEHQSDLVACVFHIKLNLLLENLKGGMWEL